MLSRTDSAHDVAVAEFRRLREGDEQLVSHNYVLVEAAALVQSRLGLPALTSFRDDLLPVVEIEWVDRDLHNRALAATIASGRRDVSLVDRVSFELMRELGVSTAFAFDADFDAEGFEVVPRA